jgi:hypothetical protein
MIVLMKGQRFEQTSPTIARVREASSTVTEKPFALEAFAEGMASDSLISGTLQIPGGTNVPLARVQVGSTEIRNEYQMDTLLDLETGRPNGTYTFTIVTKNDGTNSASLDLIGDAYPNVPVVTNYTALQTMINTNVTLVQWAAMSGGTVNDIIFLNVYDPTTGNVVFEVGGPGTLDGTAVQTTIPANTLQSGKSYQAELMFLKIVHVTSVAGSEALVAAGYYKRVVLTIQTVPASEQTSGAEFEAAIPSSSSINVPRDSAVSFHFSKPMNPSFMSVSWTNAVPANFVYEWTEENTVLLCRYNTNLLADTQIGWSLNLSGFKDAANSNLTGSVSGTFHTSLDVPQSLPDVSFVSLVKMCGYLQTNAVPVATGMYGCEASVEMPAFNRVKSGTLAINANGRGGALVADEWYPEIGLNAMYASKSDLDRFFENGTFTFAVDTLNAGAANMTLNLGVTDDYPIVPTVTNLVALQAVDPASTVTVNWTAPADWTNNIVAGHTFVEMGIENDQGEEVFWKEGFDFTSGAECVIPANTLWPGRTYHVTVSFIKIKDVNTPYPGVTGVAGFSTITEFTLQTTGTVGMPTVTISRNGSNIALSITGGESQRGYVGEASQDLQRWLPLTELWVGVASQNYPLYDGDAHYLKKRFYRLRDQLPGERVAVRRMIQGTVLTNLSAPLVGAVVSTDLDSQTTVTDEFGRFFLETDTPATDGQSSYTISVTKGALHKDFGPGVWGDQPRDQTFEMN